MQRQFVVRIVVVLMCAFIIASGTVIAQQSEPITIEWGLYTNPGNQQEMLDRFHTKHPDIRVKIVQWSGIHDMRESLPVMIAGGVAPDVHSIDTYSFASWVRQGWLLSLDEFMANDDYYREEEIIPAALRTFRMEEGSYVVGSGSLYALPKTFQTSGMMVYNMQLFDEAGRSYPDDSWTWETELEALRSLTMREGDGSFRQAGTRFENDTSFVDRLLYPRVWQAGGDYVDPEFSRSLATETEAVSGLEWLVDLAQEHEVASLTRQQAGRFPQGGIGIDYVGQAVFWHARWTDKEVVPFEWGIALHPKHPETGSRMAQALATGHAVNSSSDHPEAAWTFLSYLAGPDEMMHQASEMRAVPHIPSATEFYSSGGQDGMPVGLGLIMEHFQSVHPNHYLGVGGDDIYQLIRQQGYEAIRGRISAQEAMLQISDGINSILSRIRE